jgi:EAL domain-containing protein (putative c-di-GMP-specific phosphodiesterase class I)
MSVNLSARQLRDPNLVRDVEAVLRDTGIAPHTLTLEITETVLMDSDAAIDDLHRLKALGIRLAIDDFGTGYSSLAYLQSLPVDILKIDRSFLHDAGAAGLSPLARGIVDLGRAMRLVMVAEGIEQPEQVAALRAAGCELGQGFHLARPMEADAFDKLLRSRASLPAPAAS